jgi:hypothetical protein
MWNISWLLTWEQLVFAWDMLGDMAFLTVQPYMVTVNLQMGDASTELAKAGFCGGPSQELTSKYVLAKQSFSVLARA